MDRFLSICSIFLLQNLSGLLFMDVNYGQAVKDYLLREVNLLRIHRFAPKDVQLVGLLG
jgi:adenine-specific DNA-methyltransferase